MTSFDFENDSIITDTTGSNILDLTVNGAGVTRDKLNLFFDVSLKKNKNGTDVIKNKKAVAVYGQMTFTTDNGADITTGVLSEGFDELGWVDVSSKKSITTVKINDTSYALNYKSIDNPAQDVANLLHTNSFASIDDAFVRGSEDQITELIAKYTSFSDNNFANV